MCTERRRKHLQHGQGWLRKIPRGERTVVAREEVGATGSHMKVGWLEQGGPGVGLQR